MKVLGIDNGEGAVKPDPETIQDGSYAPLSRPIYTYANLDSLKDKPQVLDFVKFTLENAGAKADEVGYVALSDEEYQEQIEEVESWVEEE